MALGDQSTEGRQRGRRSPIIDNGPTVTLATRFDPVYEEMLGAQLAKVSYEGTKTQRRTRTPAYFTVSIT